MPATSNTENWSTAATSDDAPAASDAPSSEPAPETTGNDAAHEIEADRSNGEGDSLHGAGAQFSDGPSKDDFVPLDPAGKLVTWCACGPRVYEDAHLGHAKNYVSRTLTEFFAKTGDVLLPYFDSLHGAEMDSNNHQSYLDLSQKFEHRFFEDMEALNILPPDRLTRMTEYVLQIIRFVEKIVANGFGYAAPDGSVYFDIDAFEKAGHSYSRLEPWNKNDRALQADGEGSLSKGKSMKRRENHFALCKASKPGLKMSKSLKNYTTIRAVLASQKEWTARSLWICFLLMPWQDGIEVTDGLMKAVVGWERKLNNFFLKSLDVWKPLVAGRLWELGIYLEDRDSSGQPALVRPLDRMLVEARAEREAFAAAKAKARLEQAARGAEVAREVSERAKIDPPRMFKESGKVVSKHRRKKLAKEWERQKGRYEE
ncbi:tRNA synthetases class I (C) catalytic domain-containing protein [Staphylotrichum tortipilum]|uniref:tRNA synthetases class I (C) catalytic domain-containing protein n=1 Tax=Staphylotrichum tortipilum TaxID=2831512 RepID=A0AAN6ME21_9PEZI|nr:tRNA synthetases class I (C) catalytic domain-containing protein [Staphylotrichum longicolle]